VELDPDDPEVNAHLADAFFAEGRRLQADYQWRRALALKPDPRLQATIEERLKHAGPPA
jgi:Flp pilus assembly protein TadD